MNVSHHTVREAIDLVEDLHNVWTLIQANRDR